MGAADDWVGGLPLTTVQTGTVTGDLYISGNPPSTGFSNAVDRTFTLPAAAVAESGRVKWARLYVSSYCGHMQDAKKITYTTSVDWDNDGTWDNTWTETDEGQPFIYLQGGDYGDGGNDNSEFAGHGTGEPYLMLNDHTNRVTSDYLSWYDVTNLVQAGEDTIKVKVDSTGSYDGRIKVVTLVVAYDDPASTTQTTYWVNEGHDACTYYTEDNLGEVAVGTTTFDTSGLSGITSAKLTADYMASNNGYYGFPTSDNNFDASAKTGSFTNIGLDRVADAQGDYSGIDSWDVTSSVSGSSSVMFAYARYLPGTGTAAFYKIPLAFLVVKSQIEQTPQVDLTIASIVNPVPASAVFSREQNSVKITNIKNSGPETATNIQVALYASDVSNGTVPANTTTIASLGSGAQTTVTLIDPTIRNLEGDTVTYTARVDPDNLIPETNEANNNKSSAAKLVKYNGYKGKGIYWEGGSNITTKNTFDLHGNLLYSTQPESAYKGVGGWGSGRTETWSASDLPIPAGSTIEKALLYFAYNWDQTPGGYPWLNINFNGNIIENGNLSTGNGILYRDWSNFGGYADYEYGLCVYDVTDKFSSSENSLVTVPYDGNNDLYGKVALYPSTLVVVYRNSNETRKQIFINEECDELGLSESSYGTTPEEAIAYVPFTGMTIDKTNVVNAMLYSFAGSAGPDEGNLLFNGNTVATNAWMGSSNTASPLVFNATNYITETVNEFGIQSTTSGGMDALQQILVVEYQAEQESAPVANFTADPTSGTVPLDVQFTDASTGTVSSYAWDFDNDGIVDSNVQSPSYTYSEPGTYTVNLTVTGSGGSDSEVKTGYIVVNGSSKSDLIVSAIAPNVGEIFANETNTIAATVTNIGAADSGNFTVKFTINGVDTNVATGGLAVGANTTLTITDSALRTLGDSVEITVTADSNNEVSEFDETNNSMTLTKTVVNNGYKGKRYTGGNDITTQATFEGRHGIVYSAGNTAYNSANWTAKTYTWSSTNLPIPAGTTVVSARLYQAYSYNKMGTDPAFTMSFNSNTVTPIATYKDQKSYGMYNYPYGLYVYNVTSLFNSSGNSITITPEASNDYAMWGAYMVVVYHDPAGKTGKIWINDEFDILAAGNSYAVTSDEATAYASFSGVNASGVSKATAIAILASASDVGKSKFYFNNQEYPGFWSDYLSNPQMGFSSYDVTGAIHDGTDTARLLSYLNGSSGDSMYAMNTILMAEYLETAPVADFTAVPTSGDAPLTVQFTDASTGSVSSYSWDFNNDGTVDSTEQNPSCTYESAGNYTVSLMVSNAGGSDSEVKTDYITVSSAPVEPEPVAAFTADVTGGTAPLTVNFTDQSTGTPTSWFWDFGDGTSATDQNPSHTYNAAGNYTVNLTVENAAGKDFELKSDYIEVSGASGSTVTLYFDPENSSVSENESIEINVVASNFPEGLSGYNLTVAIDDPTVAEIVDIEYPSWGLITENSSLPGTSIYLKTVDGEDTVKAGATDVVLATLTVSGKKKGSANLSIGVKRLDDDSGNIIEPAFLTGRIEVTLLSPLPDQEYAPQDLDGDGFYEDLTGNGEFSFVDIVAYFHNMDWIEENMPVEYFDLNGNGRIDFDDVARMFAMI
nr:DUF3344 domain-containing protein [Methanosarcina horonobensis]